jgi:hypothetical protein
MTSSHTNVVVALGLVATGVALAAAGIYIGETDDAPGAALLGIVLMIGAVALAVRRLWRQSRRLAGVQGPSRDA